MTRFQFVADHRDAFEVKRMCRLLDVHRSAFYAWEATAPARAARAATDAELAQRIRAVHADHRANRAYGGPRITAELNDGAPDSERVNYKRVARVMAEHKIAGIRLRRPVRTTIPEPAGQQVPDLLERDFTAAAPNVKYAGDITYLPCGDGTNLYLATVIDCYSRRLVGWSIADHMRTELVADALLAAAATRGSLAGAIFHSDHGGQGAPPWEMVTAPANRRDRAREPAPRRGKGAQPARRVERPCGAEVSRRRGGSPTRGALPPGGPRRAG